MLNIVGLVNHATADCKRLQSAIKTTNYETRK